MAAVIAYGWSSPALPKLRADDSPIPINDDDGAWIVAFLKLGMLLAPLPAAWSLERFGRKRTLLMATVPLALSWILLAVAQSVYLVCLFTLLAGMALACSYVVLPVYITEIASDHIRGYLGILHTVMCKLGLLYIYAVGPFVSVRLMAWLGLVPVGLFLVSFVWLPESPYHLVASGRREAAEQSLRRLRRSGKVDEELDAMTVAVQRDKQGTLRELLMNRGNRRSLITVMGLAALLELCGSQLMLHYAQTIFERLDSGISSGLASVVFGLVQLGASVLACFLVDTMGRRPLLLVSVVGTALANAVIGVYFVLERWEVDVRGVAWLPLVAIMAIMITYTIGILALLTVITSELFPKHLRGVAGSVKFIVSSLVGLLMVLLYEVVQRELGSDYLFFGFAAVTLAYVPFVWLMVPETKRRALTAICDGIQAQHATTESTTQQS